LVLPFIVTILAMDVILATLACMLERDLIVRTRRSLPMRLIYRPMLTYCIWKRSCARSKAPGSVEANSSAARRGRDRATCAGRSDGWENCFSSLWKASILAERTPEKCRLLFCICH